MDLFSLLVTLSAFLSTLYLVLEYWKRKDLPPSPSFGLPFIGHSLAISAKDFSQKMMKWSEEVGDLYTLYFGNKAVVVMNSFDIIKEVYHTRAEEFSSRPFHYYNWAIGADNAGILFSSGPNWKEQRAVSHKILRTMGMGKNILAQVIQQEVVRFLDQIATKGGEAQNIDLLTNLTSANCICSVLLGQGFEYDDEFFQDIVRKVDYLEHNLGGLGPDLFEAFPVLHYLPGDLCKMKTYLKVKNHVRTKFFTSFIRQKGDVEYEEGTIDNFIAHYVKEMNDKKANGKETALNEMNLVTVIENMFLAGTEALSIMVRWFVLFMMSNPKVQEKMFQEIDDVVGRERLPNMHDKSKLKYVNAVIHETQRVGNVGPSGLPHTASRDTTLRGFKIPKGTTMLANVNAVFNDKKIWGEDTDTFRPERHIDEAGNLKHFEEFIPFSVGKRVCLGESMGKMELFLYISTMVQRFRILAQDVNHPPPIKGYMNILVYSPLPFEVRFVERSKE